MYWKPSDLTHHLTFKLTQTITDSAVNGGGRGGLNIAVKYLILTVTENIGAELNL